MFAVVTPEKIHLPPGAILRLPGSWEDYQKLVECFRVAGDRNTSTAIRELRQKLAIQK